MVTFSHGQSHGQLSRVTDKVLSVTRERLFTKKIMVTARSRPSRGSQNHVTQSHEKYTSQHYKNVA
eukprot:scaffold193_cov157-Skeletonema_menzelii.AAC.3